MAVQPPVENMEIDASSKLRLSEQAQYQYVVEKVMEYMSRSDFKTLRLVSRGFEQIFRNSQSLKSFKFTVDGQMNPTGVACNDPVETLIGSPVHWPTIIFKNLYLEGKMMGKPEYFDAFMERNCKTLKDLHFDNCSLSFSRFVEILAWMESLKSLTVINCPRFFALHQSLLNFEFLIPDFLNTLNRLRSFTLKGFGLKIDTIIFFLSSTPKLVSLNFQSTNAKFPDGLIQAIARLKDTLRVLTLSGEFYLDRNAMDVLGEFDLKFLSLDKFTISENGRFATRFLQKQVNLRKLLFKNMDLDFYLFLQIHLQIHLVSLLLSDCKLMGPKNYFHTLVNFNRVNTLQEISIKCADYAQSKEELGVLFDYPRPALLKTRLTGCQIVSGNILKSLSENCQNLQILEIHQGKLVNRDLQWVWKLENLKKLVMRHCNLSDEALSNPCLNLSSKSLCDLRRLTYLDLSCNYISDETIKEQIIQMPHLHKIALNATRITINGLDVIATQRKWKLQNLASIEFYQCRGCEYTPEMARNLELQMAPINLYFEDAVKWTTPGSYI